MLSDAGSAIIRFVSRKEILGTLIFDIGGGRRLPLSAQKGKTFCRRGTMHGEKEPGNPDKDLGASSVARYERRRAAYAILRIWLYKETANFQSMSRVCEMRYVVYSAWRVFIRVY